MCQFVIQPEQLPTFASKAPYWIIWLSCDWASCGNVGFFAWFFLWRSWSISPLLQVENHENIYINSFQTFSRLHSKQIIFLSARKTPCLTVPCPKKNESFEVVLKLPTCTSPKDISLWLCKSLPSSSNSPSWLPNRRLMWFQCAMFAYVWCVLVSLFFQTKWKSLYKTLIKLQYLPRSICPSSMTSARFPRAEVVHVSTW